MGWQETVSSLPRRLYRLGFSLVGPDVVTHEIDGLEAEYRVRTPTEYDRLAGRLMRTNRPVIEDMLAQIDRDDIVWDVGAHLGRFSCFLGQRLTEGSLVAFEPYPPNVNSLEANLAQNGIDAIVHRFALAETETEVRAPLTREESGVFISTAHEAGRIEQGDSTTTVPTKRGDEVVRAGEAPPPTVVRIDASGGEPRVLEGMTGCLEAPRCRLVYITAYRHRYETPDSVDSTLREAGFDIEHIETPGELDILRGSR